MENTLPLLKLEAIEKYVSFDDGKLKNNENMRSLDTIKEYFLLEHLYNYTNKGLKFMFTENIVVSDL